jgi:hypothetical protein
MRRALVLQGSRIWIGTTEAATLLRQFGCRARVVDFVGARATVVRCNAGSRSLGQMRMLGCCAAVACSVATRRA